MNWKSITTHALLLLIVGISSGILEPQPSHSTANGLLLSYFLSVCVLHLLYAGIFAHIAFRVENHPFAHALLAMLLSHEVASILLTSFLSYMRVESPVHPLPLLAIEYTMLVIALAGGTFAGTRLRRRSLSQSGALGRTEANA